MKIQTYTLALGLLFVSSGLAAQTSGKRPPLPAGASSTMGVVGLSQRRLVLFDVEKPSGPPKLLIYKTIPKPDEVSTTPVLIPEFKELNSSPASESATVSPEKVLMEEAKRRREQKAAEENKVDDGEQPGESSKEAFDDDNIEY